MTGSGRRLPHAADEPTADASAGVVVPLVLSLTRADSVIDIGCGVGTWLRAFLDHGISDALGVDGPAVRDHLRIPRSLFVEHDLTKPFSTERSYDLVVSLEVAEHLPAAAAEVLVATVAAAGDLVLFSAAIPGQKGPGHTNCQWPEYWLREFSRHGFIAADILRATLWEDERVAWWYRQNILLLGRPPRFEALGIDETPVRALVHPRCLEANLAVHSPSEAMLGVVKWARSRVAARVRGQAR